MSGSKLAPLLFFVFGFAVATAPAQTQTQPQPPQPQSQAQSQSSQAPQAAPAVPPAAKPADVSSPDAILAAICDVISGPAGQKRDWDRFRSLFLPGARLAAVGKGKDGNLHARALTPEEYITFGDPYFEKNGFFERETARHADRYAHIMQVFSTYESRHDKKDPSPFARGINSFQLFFDGSRWWVVTIYWEEETADTPLPKEFLPAAH